MRCQRLFSVLGAKKRPIPTNGTSICAIPPERRSNMILGIPKEIMHEEYRVAAIPETVEKFVKLGFKVLVESDAGEGVFLPDSEYKKAGAEIAKDAKTLFENSDVILKVKQPEFNKQMDLHEIEMMREDSILITFLHPAAPMSHSNVIMLQEKGITALTMDGIPRISRAQRMDALTSMSTITGYKSVILAANSLPRFIPMISTAIGMIKPAIFLVVGTGVVGLQAIATAKRLGAVVKIVDIRPEARKEAESLGAKIAGFDVPEELAKGKGGYAKALPREWLEKERECLRPLVAEADGVILSALVPGEVAPVLITGDMLFSMRPGSVIIDVAIDQGGNCAVTRPGCEIVSNHVKVCGLQNIPGKVAVHSSWLYANNIYYYVENLFKNGKGKLDIEDEIVKNSLVTYQGKLLHEGTLKALSEKEVGK
jgi:NAD(P) transhydrogenase subunit alpha